MPAQVENVCIPMQETGFKPFCGDYYFAYLHVALLLWINNQHQVSRHEMKGHCVVWFHAYNMSIYFGRNPYNYILIFINTLNISVHPETSCRASAMYYNKQPFVWDLFSNGYIPAEPLRLLIICCGMTPREESRGSNIRCASRSLSESCIGYRL